LSYVVEKLVKEENIGSKTVQDFNPIYRSSNLKVNNRVLGIVAEVLVVEDPDRSQCTIQDKNM
jgi:hypothetical protein